MLLGPAGAFAQSVTGQVFQLIGALDVITVDDSYIKPVISKQTITTQHIINLALGNSSTSLVPANKVLALVVATETNMAAMIVLDTVTTSNLATFVIFTTDGVAVKGKGTGVFSGLVAPVSLGNDTNGISGGFLAMSGSMTLTTSNTLASFKGNSVIGSIRCRVRSNDFDAIVTKGKLTTVRKLPFSLPIPEFP
jgi:hypothetical protein